MKRTSFYTYREPGWTLGAWFLAVVLVIVAVVLALAVADTLSTGMSAILPNA